MNKFAQLLYGKVIYIYETDLKKEELSTIFDPSTFWVDVTGQDVGVGDVATFDSNLGIVFKKPEEEEETEKTLDELKEIALKRISEFTEQQITGGFIMQVSDQLYKFDSDVDTQNTMALVYSASQSADFETTAPYYGKIPCRGYLVTRKTVTEAELQEQEYVDGSYTDNGDKTLTVNEIAKDKSVVYLDKQGIQDFINALTVHIGKCKQAGWVYQQRINEATTKEEIEEWLIQ